MFLAGLLGAVFTTLFPLNSFIASEYTLTGLLLVSLIGVFLPVPIALDVVLASVLMASGLPIAYVMALLFTLGTFSVCLIYSVRRMQQSWNLLSHMRVFVFPAQL